MPVLTRSKYRLLHSDGISEPLFALKPDKKTKQPFKIKPLATLKKKNGFQQTFSSRELNTLPHSSRKNNLPQTSSDHSLSQDSSTDNLSPYSKGKAPPQTTTNFHSLGSRSQVPYSAGSHLPVPIDNSTRGSWACRKCSCYEGVFKDLVDRCIRCDHTMGDHEIPFGDPWNPKCDFLCRREELVSSVLQHARQYGVVVIRATPQVGKTTLLNLLGHHIAYEVPDLHPVLIHWNDRKRRQGLPYEEYLAQEETKWRTRNTRIRPHNPTAQTIYLIDEAQGSYEEVEFWSSLKNHHVTRGASLFVLVCVYGPTGVSHIRNPDIESQALRMHSLQRIELRPIIPGAPSMLFRRDEVSDAIKKFATVNSFQLGNGVSDYLFRATDGHPGMVGLIISHLDKFTARTGLQLPQPLSARVLHDLIVQHEDSFVEYLSLWGRGVWSPWGEKYVERSLTAPRYQHISLLDIKRALREVSLQPHGLSRVQRHFDAFAFCHKWGLLHTERQIHQSEETIFTFASPLHRRVAYRRLFSGREPDAVVQDLSLQQLCINAIARMSPGTLQKRRSCKSNRSWGIPEAAFQDELYCCLNLELHYLPILSEYSHTQSGRIDFYISDRKWGIEVLQCGSDAEIDEHVARFATHGKYQTWNIMDDHVILNFCSRSVFLKVKNKDKRLQSHVLHVVIDPDDMIAEIYTCEKQLQKSWSLSEGRQRVSTESYHNIDELDSSHCSLSQAEAEAIERNNLVIDQQMDKVEQKEQQLDQMWEQMEQEKKEMRQQLEQEMRQQLEREKKEMRQQLEREKKEMRQQLERDMMEMKQQDGGIAKEQDILAPRHGMKRKR